MTEQGETGIPEVDALIARHDAERNTLNAAFAVSTAEGTVATARESDLVQQQTAARRRWTAAKGLLTKARKDGNAAKIAAARTRCDDAYRQFTAISDAAIREMQQILGARLDSNGALLEQTRRTWDAGSAVTDALAHPAPPGRGR
jgi:hypothetical protein